MQTRFPNHLVPRLLLALALATPFAAQAAVETTGRISGYVYDPTGAALSEVPLSVSGPELQGVKNTTSGDDGRYGFDQLPPGDDYVIEVNVPGFTPIQQKGIKVLLGQTQIVDINLTVMTETSAAQTFQIIEKVNPVLNPDSAAAVAVIDAEKAAATPIFQQVEGMAQQVAGVGPGTRPSTRGGLARHGKFYVDGLDTTDVTDGSITAPMNFNAVQNFEILAGAMDAQYNAMGMITNAVTKSGGNKFTYDFALTFMPPVLAAKNNFPAQQQGIFGEYINNSDPAPAISYYSPVFNVGGPLIKDKLWFFVSGQMNFNVRENPISILGAKENRPQNTLTQLGRIKLTWQATEKDKVSFAFNVDRNRIENDIGTASATLDAERVIDRGGYFFIVNYDHSFTDSVLFQLQTGLTRKAVDTDPMKKDADGNTDYTTISHFDTQAVTARFNASSISAALQGNYLHETKWRIQFDPTVSWKLRGFGTHQMKAGVQASWLIDRQATGVSGDRRYTDFGGVCNEADPNSYAACSSRTDYYGNNGGSLTTDARVLNLGTFVQDRWSVNRRLTLIPGLRFDTGVLYGDNGDHIATLLGLGPRFSATFDLLGDRRTLVVGHAGRSNDIGNIFIAQHANPTLTAVTSRWQSATNSFPTCTPYSTDTGCSTAGGPAGRQFYTHDTLLFSKVAPSPSMDELSAGIHTEVTDETVLGIDYTWRRYNNLWADEEINRIWDPSGTKVLGYANGEARTIYVIKAADSAKRRYNGLDVWVNGTPGRWDLLASYTLSFNTGTVQDYFDGYLNNPRMTQFFDGYVQDDQRHTLKGSIAYKTSFGLDLGIRVQYRTGGTNWMNFSNSADTSGGRIWRSPRGTGFPTNSATGQPDFNDPNSWTEIRSPDQFTLDLQARYNFGRLLQIKQKLELVLLVVNALNDSGMRFFTDSWATSNSRFGLASSHNTPLQAEFILRFRN